MIPVARTENILLTEVDNEVMIYDRENDSCHCLNPVAAQVWRYCDGYNTVDDIANLLEQEMALPEDAELDIRGLVWLALEELERCHLIKEYVREPIPDEVGVSRRKVLGKTARFDSVGGCATTSHGGKVNTYTNTYTKTNPNPNSNTTKLWVHNYRYANGNKWKGTYRGYFM
jgi:hypothetical protein